jgi:hypothetical protein
MEDVFDAMDDLQHEEEVEELRASQRVAQEENEEQEPPQHPASASAKTREPLAERPLELDTSIVGPVATTTAAVNEGDTTTREEGGTEEGDETRQADFEVHEGEDNQEHRGEDNEEREDMSNREVEAPGPRAEDTTAEQEEDEIESDEDIPATQKPSHEVDGVSHYNFRRAELTALVRAVLRGLDSDAPDRSEHKSARNSSCTMRTSSINGRAVCMYKNVRIGQADYNVERYIIHDRKFVKLLKNTTT